MTEESLQILLVDDEESLRVPLAKRLREHYGYAVTTVPDGAAAVRAVKAAEGRFDVALIDQSLEPEFDGIAVMRQIKHKYPEIECIIFTGWGTERRQQVIQAGAFRYLEKPFDLTELAMLIRTAAQQVRLRAIGRSILSNLDQDQLLDEIVASARSLGFADHASIVLLNEETGKLEFKRTAEIPRPSWKRHFCQRQLSREIIVEGRVVSIRDVTLESDLDPGFQATGLRALTGLPIPGLAKTLGVLYVYSRKPAHFEDWGTVAVLQTLASQAGLALANARAFEQSRQRARYLEALADIAQDMTRTTDRQEQLFLASRFVREQLHADTFFIGLYDRERSILEFPVAFDEGISVPIADRVLDSDQRTWGISGYVIKTGEEKLWLTEQARQEQCNQIGISSSAVGDACQSCFYLPLRAGQDVLGVLSVQSYAPSAFDAILCDIVRTLGNQLAVALENARLHGLTQMRAQRLTTLQELTRTINQSLGQGETLTAVCKAAVEFFSVDHSGLVLFESDLRQGRVEAEYPADIATVGTMIPVQGVPRGERLTQAREPMVIENVATDDQMGSLRAILHDRFGIQSTLIVPIVSQERLVGSFSLDAIQQPRHFTAEDVEFCRLFAAQVTVAIENARLFEETRRREQLLEAMEIASRHIRGEREVPVLLHETVRLAAELVDCRFGALLTYYPALNELEISAAYGFPEALQSARFTTGEDLIGLVARSGVTRSTDVYQEMQQREATFAPYSLRAAAAIPLKRVGAVEAVLFVADDSGLDKCSGVNLDVLERFAAQAAIAWGTARAVTREQRMTDQLRILKRISDHVQTVMSSATDLHQVLHVVLTGITAGYGLGFDRVALLLLDEMTHQLNGTMGIGYLDKDEAVKDWTRQSQTGLNEFDNYIRTLEAGLLPPTPMDVAVRRLRLAVDPQGADVFSQVCSQPVPRRVDSHEGRHLPTDFVTALDPAFPLLVAPLVARQKVLGLLIVDHKFTQAPITDELVESLMTFVNEAAIALDNYQLYHEAKQGQENLRAFYAASNALVTGRDFEQVRRDIVERARQTAQANTVCMVLIDTAREIQDLLVAGADEPTDVSEVVQKSGGLSMQITDTGVPVIIEDSTRQQPRLNPSPFWRHVRAALGLPLVLEGERLGVMWFLYDHPRHFAHTEIEAAQFYANQAAIAQDSASRMTELEQMRQAAEDMARTVAPREALQTIVVRAVKVLGADSAVVWPYDDATDQFILSELVFTGIPSSMMEDMLRQESTPGRTAQTVMTRGYLHVSNLDLEPVALVGQNTRDMLTTIGVQSFQGIVLRAGEETIGVLYVNYQRPKVFVDEDETRLRTFASHAALALNNARLLAQLDRTRQAARAIAGVTVREDLQETLRTIARNTRQVLGAGVVNIYAFDEQKQRFTHAAGDNPTPVTEDFALPVTNLKPQSTVWNIFRLESPYYYICPDKAAEDPILQGRFTSGENIQAAMGIQLRVAEHRVGVMFVNYRAPHRFSNDDTLTIQLFADQAAVAIRNASLYAETERRGNTLNTLVEAGKIVTATLTLEQTLERITRQSLELVSGVQVSNCFSHLALKAGNRLWFTTASDPMMLARLLATVQEIDLEADTRKTGIVGRAARSGLSQLVDNIESDGDYIRLTDTTRSQLSVPIMQGDRVIGVISVEHPELSAFQKEDQLAIENLAAQAAHAILNARLYEQAQIVAKISREAAQQRELSEFVSTLFGNLHDAFARYHIPVYLNLGTYDRNRNALVFEKTDFYPSPMDPSVLPLATPGIMTHVARTRKPYYVADTEQDSVYREIVRDTRSEMAAPILFDSELLGVLDAASPLTDAFAPEDQAMLGTLANQIATLLRNVQQYAELKRTYEDLRHTRRRVAGTTALAWVGMASSVWRHTIEKHAVTIRNQAIFLKRDLDEAWPNWQETKLPERVAMVQRLSQQIMEKPINAPLSAEAGLKQVSVSALIGERARQLWENQPYKLTHLSLDLQAGEEVTVSASPEWLRRAFDVLFENAVNAVEHCDVKDITVSTRIGAAGIEIAVSDTGPGIPDEIRSKLTLETIERPEDVQGLGMGLLMAQTIIQTFGGEIRVGATGPTGTRMIIWLPTRS